VEFLRETKALLDFLVVHGFDSELEFEVLELGIEMELIVERIWAWNHEFRSRVAREDSLWVRTSGAVHWVRACF